MLTFFSAKHVIIGYVFVVRKTGVALNDREYQTQRRCHNVATTSHDWLYRRCQFVVNENFANIS